MSDQVGSGLAILLTEVSVNQGIAVTTWLAIPTLVKSRLAEISLLLRGLILLLEGHCLVVDNGMISDERGAQFVILALFNVTFFVQGRVVLARVVVFLRVGGVGRVDCLADLGGERAVLLWEQVVRGVDSEHVRVRCLEI
mmetsp:Transcript_2260/g.3080  ORF Transcript_2260/g.3080 Transcript_2260/m.3080 type:complete len:140 (+) Transcript_2260:2244-2663(+)